MDTIRSLLEGPQGKLVLSSIMSGVAALLIVAVGWILGAWVGATVHRRSELRAGPTLAPLLGKVTRIAINVLALVAAVGQLGVDTTSFLAVLGAAGLAVGLALKDTLSDLASGVVLLVLRSFDVGEAVDIGGKGGVVARLDLFETSLTTFEGVPLVLPNSQVRTSAILNYSRARTRRIDLLVGISYGDDIPRALAVLSEMLAAEPRVLDDPEPVVNVDALGESEVRLLARYHCVAADFLTLKMDMIRRSKELLEQAGASIPFPQRDLHLKTGSLG